MTEQLQPLSPLPVQGFSLASLLLIIALVAVLLTGIRLQPLIGFVAAILAMPTLARTVSIINCRKRSGTRTSARQQVLIFSETAAAMVAAVFVGSIPIISILAIAGTIEGLFDHSWINAVTRMLVLPLCVVLAGFLFQGVFNLLAPKDHQVHD